MNTHFPRSVETEQRDKIFSEATTSPVALTYPASDSSFKPPPEFHVQNDEFLRGTPTQSNANVHKSCTICPRPQSSSPLKFVHHDGSPFTTFRQNFRVSQDPVISANIDSKHATPPRTLQGLTSCRNVGKYTPSYDTSTWGNSMKSPLVVKSFDNVADDQGDLEDPEVKHYSFKNPIIFTPPTPEFELSTKRQKDHQKAHPPLPIIKLTPRTRKREFGQGDATAESLRRSIETFPSRIKLFPKNEGNASAEDRHSKETTFLDPDHTHIPILSLPTPTIPTELQFNNDDNMEETACAQTIRHFPRTLACYQKKSRSLFEPNSSFDPIQRLILADAMVEASRKNDPLTDDEDSDVECNPDYVLCCPPSTGKRRGNAVLSSGMSNVSNCGTYVESAVSAGKRFGSSHVLPAAALQQDKSLSSVHCILGNNDLLDEELRRTKTLHIQAVNAHVDFLKATQSNADIFPSAMSSDSAVIDVNQNMFTPPPILEKGNDFRTLSPPLLCPKIERV